MHTDVFHALADPTRRTIVTLLSQSDKSLNEITPHFDMSRPAISKHIRVLHQADLITITPQGRRRIHSFNPQGLKPAKDWLRLFDAFWDEKLDTLKTLIESETS